MTKLQADFIKVIGNAAVNYYKEYRILPSLTIAQAILESNWGKSGLSRDCYNFFGMKWVNGCGCGYKEYKTKEQKKDGTYVTITARFRKYNSVSEGIKGYYDFLQYKRYSNLIGETDYKKACELIREDGWATSLSYAQSLKKYIEQYHLEEYDRKAFDMIENAAFRPKKYIVTASAIKVRTGAGTSFAWKNASDTFSAQVNAYGKAVYKKGTAIEVLEEIKISDGEIWGRTTDGYVALRFTGNSFVKECTS